MTYVVVAQAKANSSNNQLIEVGRSIIYASR